MNIALDNIFKRPEPPTRYVKVDRKIGLNRWKVFDVYGRTFFVDSSDEWKRGDSVSIQLGRIVERVPTMEDPTTYEV